MHRDPSLNFPSETSERIDYDAALWAVRHDHGLNPEEAKAFAAWKQAHRSHARAYERIGRTWARLEDVNRLPGMMEMADAVIARGQQRRARRRRIVHATSLFAAAAALTFAIVTWRPLQNAAPPDAMESTPAKPGYQVLASTAHQVTLPDGSIAELNGDSRITTDYSATERRIRLIHGEAHFTVMKDADRPFLVSTGNVAVRAVGTAFNVRLSPRTIEVLVTEGKVEVDDTAKGGSLLASLPDGTVPLLTAGQKMTVSKADQATDEADVRITKVEAREIDQTLAWQNTRLVFDDTPLDEVVGAFNRYNRHRLLLNDPSLRQRTLTGVFKADNLDGFIRLLEAGADVTSRPGAPGVTILMATR